jgi:hypothetical protein
MDLREMVRHRAGLVKIRTSLENKVHAHLLMHRLKVEGTPFTKAYMDKLRAIQDYKTDGRLNVIALNHEIDQIECTHSHIRAEPDSSIAIFHKRLLKKKGKAKATVAASVKLMKVVYWVMKEKRPYHS